MFKVKSHLDKIGAVAITDGRIRIDRLLGNALADTVADAAAIVLEPCLNTVSTAKWCDRIGFSVAKRIAVCQADA